MPIQPVESYSIVPLKTCPKKLLKKKKEKGGKIAFHTFFSRREESFSLLISDLKMTALLLYINVPLAHKFRAIILVNVTNYSLRHHSEKEAHKFHC